MDKNDDRQMLREKALQKMKWTVSNVKPGYMHNVSPMDKNEFVRLLKHNFDRLDQDHSQGISRDEITAALMNASQFTADEHIMLQLLIRYFDFISDLVDDGHGAEKVVSKQDVEVLSQFLLNSNMNLEELYLWCNASNDPKPTFTPPPLSSSDGEHS